MAVCKTMFYICNQSTKCK